MKTSHFYCHRSGQSSKSKHTLPPEKRQRAMKSQGMIFHNDELHLIVTLVTG